MDASIPILVGFSGDLIVKLYINGSIPIRPSISGTAYVNPIYTDLEAQLTMPLLKVDSWGYEGCRGIANLTLPVKTLAAEGYDSAVGKANLSLGVFQVDGEGHDSVVGKANLSIPIFGISATGLDSTIGKASLILPMLKLSTAITSNEIGWADLRMPLFLLQGNIIAGAVGEANISLPMPWIYGLGLMPSFGTANLTMPMLVLNAATDLLNDFALTMNAKNNCLTTYSNFGFNSMCNFNGRNLGAKQSGIFDLSGDTDDNDNLTWNFRTGLLDLEVGQKKRIKQAWLGYKGNGDLKMKAILSNGESYEYPIFLYEDFFRSRVKFGKGIKTRYIAIDVSSDEGAKIELDVLKLHFDLLREKR